MTPPSKEVINDQRIVAPTASNFPGWIIWSTTRASSSTGRHLLPGPGSLANEACRRRGRVLMSLGAVSWALNEVRGVNPVERCVLLILADHADPIGIGASTLPAQVAQTLGIPDRTVGYALESLQRKGLIRRDERPSQHAGDLWDLAMTAEYFFATAINTRSTGAAPQGDQPSGIADVRPI